MKPAPPVISARMSESPQEIEKKPNQWVRARDGYLLALQRTAAASSRHSSIRAQVFDVSHAKCPEPIAGVEDQLGRPLDRCVIEVVVIRDQHDQISVPDLIAHGSG